VRRTITAKKGRISYAFEVIHRIGNIHTIECLVVIGITGNVLTSFPGNVTEPESGIESVTW
jgi:hypothetical protein